MNLAQLKAKRDTEKATFKAFLDKILGEGRAPSAEEQATIDGHKATLAGLDAQISTAELAASLAPAAAAARPAAPAVAVLDAGPVAPTPGVEAGAPRWAADPNRGFRNIAEFALAVKGAQDIGMGKVRGQIDERLLATATPSNFHTTQGEGAEIPPGMRDGIWELVFSDPLMGLLNIEPTDKPAVDVIADETTPWGAAGIQARWRAEATAMTADKLVTKTKQCRVHELYGFALVPEELLDDAPRLADRLNRKMPAAIIWKLVESFVTGTGAGQPLGWMSANNPAKVQVTRSGANLVAAADVLGMYERLLVLDGQDKSFWLGNRAIAKQLMTMTIGQQPVWLPPTGLAGSPSGGFLLGLPLFWSDHAETLGTAGDLQLINPAGYYALSRGAAKNDTSIHLFFDYAITAFRSMVRFGGQPFMDAVVTPAKGTTRAFFVHLS